MPRRERGRRRLWRWLKLGALCLLLLGGGQACSLRRGARTVTVASSDALEPTLAAQVTITLLREESGCRVVDKTEFGQPWAVRKALESGNVDLAWQYTGQTWHEFMGHDYPISDAGTLHYRVREEDALEDLIWLPYSACDEGLEVMVTADLASEADLITVAHLAEYLSEVESDLCLCTTRDIFYASEGVVGLMRLHGLDADRLTHRLLSLDEALAGLSTGECGWVVVPGTWRGRTSTDLVTLYDAEGYFEHSMLAPVAQETLLQAEPALEQLLSRAARALDRQAMEELTRQVVLEGRDAKAVARQFARQELIGKNEDD